MNAPSSLLPDRAAIARFVAAVFRYADEGTYVSLRSFFDDAQEVFAIQAHRLTASLDDVIGAACNQAARAARAPRPIVFAPPIATFASAASATERDLANGLALSVECDRAAASARAKLQAILGPATIVVASGGESVDPDTGEIEAKLHLHWRLSEPTRDAAGHAALKEARGLALALVGADPSSKPAVHPMRWPGSWHRKAEPRLARIVAESDTEIDPQDALERLREAWPGQRSDDPDADGDSDPSAGESRDTAALITAIVTGADYHAPIAALSMRYLKGGMTDAQVVLTLRGIMEAVPAEHRDTKDGVLQPGRWQSRYDDIPRAVSTARDKTAKDVVAAPVDLRRFRLDRFTEGAPPPQRYLLSPLMPLGKVGLLFGPGGVGKSLTALDLCIRVAALDAGPVPRRAELLGGTMPAEARGAAVLLTLEDDAEEVHRRAAALDPGGLRQDAPCFVIPAVDLPDFDPALVTAQGRAAALTQLAETGLDRLLEDTATAAGCPVRLLVLDPAGDFLDADENDAMFVKLLMRRLRAIAARHGCTIILLGHVAKTLEADAPSMRGSSAWVANSRFAYALWRPPADEAQKLGGKLKIAPESLVWGNLVKANHAGAPVGIKRLFRRDPGSGRLIDLSSHLKGGHGLDQEQLLAMLVDHCAECAAAGLPYSYSGVAGLWNGRADLPQPLSGLSKKKLEELGTKALESGVLVKARTTHSQGAPKYLDIPDGPLATGQDVEMFQGSRAEALASHRKKLTPE